jgi:hypothetical protein
LDEIPAPVELLISTGVYDSLKKMLTEDYWANQKLLAEVLWIMINLIGTASIEILEFIRKGNTKELVMSIAKDKKQNLQVYENVSVLNSKLNPIRRFGA